MEHFKLTLYDANWHLCLFTAIATVVTIAEILKNNGLAVEKSEILWTAVSYFDLYGWFLTDFDTKTTEIMTSTVDMREDAGGRPMQKAKVDCDLWMVLLLFWVLLVPLLDPPRYIVIYNQKMEN